MMRNRIRMRAAVLAGVVFMTVFAGCGGGRTTGGGGADTLYAPRYARGFAILEAGEHASLLIVRNPWQGAQGVERRVLVLREGGEAPEGFDGEVVRQPVGRAVCMSSSYVAFLDALGLTDLVAGVSGARFITNERIRERIAQGSVKDVGYDTGINYELVAGLKPDVLFTYGVETENTMMTAKMRELSVPVIYVGEYLEASPLGRAEWIVFFGELTGRREEAVALFDGIADAYNRARQAVADGKGDDSARPVVMLNAPWRDTWFVPGDRSYMVELIRDAGGAYAFAGHDTEKSLPVSTETAFVKAADADWWLNPGQVYSLRELLTLNPRFADVPSVRRGQVYNCTARRTPDGGSDFWESGAVRPDLALKDLIRMFHPERLPDHTLYYYEKLE